jgi:predicted esterase
MRWLRLLSICLLACSAEPAPSPPVTDAVAADGAALAIACDDKDIYGDPGPLPETKGAILRCATDVPIARAALEARARENGYAGKPFVSGARVYRILFRTERGGPAKLPGTSSALVYLPDSPRSARVPLIVAGRGSRGQAPDCAPSKSSPRAEAVRGDFESLVYPMVGAGYAVIAPDSAGYANFGAPGNPPSVYAGWDDMAKSMLDATRAMKRAAPALLSDDVVLFGHSQGGHTVLATLALAESYGLAGTLKGVVAAAPLWLSQRSWAALLLLSSSYPFATAGSTNMISLWYHYTHGELLDGPGKGLDVIRADKRAEVRRLMDEACWADRYPALEALGSDASDVFDPQFIDAVAAPAAVSSACATEEPAHSLCETWMKRYLADRPHLVGAAKRVPILFLYGNRDTVIGPERMACARDRLVADEANVEWCIDDAVEHSGPKGILAARASFAADWIASRTLGEPPPAACATAAITQACDTIPPND